MFQLRAQEPRWLQGGSLELADAGSDRVDDAGLWPPLERILDNRMPEGHAAHATCLRRPKPLAGPGAADEDDSRFGVDVLRLQPHHLTCPEPCPRPQIEQGQ